MVIYTGDVQQCWIRLEYPLPHSFEAFFRTNSLEFFQSKEETT
jgi:hypothetical protein